MQPGKAPDEAKKVGQSAFVDFGELKHISVCGPCVFSVSRGCNWEDNRTTDLAFWNFMNISVICILNMLDCNAVRNPNVTLSLYLQ